MDLLYGITYVKFCAPKKKNVYKKIIKIKKEKKTLS